MSKKANLPPRRALQKEYADGSTLKEIAAKYKCSVSVVWRRMYEPVRARSITKKTNIPGRFEQISALLMAGKSWREIGREIGITRQGVQDFYKRHKHSFDLIEDSTL